MLLFFLIKSPTIVLLVALLGLSQYQLADSTRTNASLFCALFATAYTACLYGPNPLPAHNARVQAAETAAGATISVMAQLIQYATVRPAAFRQNLLSLQNRQVYDMPGHPASPYTTRFLFAAAPARQDAPTGDVALVFPQNLYVQFGAPTLQTIEADFGDGRGYRPATWGQPLRATVYQQWYQAREGAFLLSQPATCRRPGFLRESV